MGWNLTHLFSVNFYYDGHRSHNSWVTFLQSYVPFLTDENNHTLYKCLNVWNKGGKFKAHVYFRHSSSQSVDLLSGASVMTEWLWLPISNHHFGFESLQGPWIISCEEVHLPGCPLVHVIMHIGPPEVFLHKLSWKGAIWPLHCWYMT
jgi:hypothetical protein